MPGASNNWWHLLRNCWIMNNGVLCCYQMLKQIRPQQRHFFFYRIPNVVFGRSEREVEKEELVGSYFLSWHNEQCYQEWPKFVQIIFLQGNLQLSSTTLVQTGFPPKILAILKLVESMWLLAWKDTKEKGVLDGWPTRLSKHHNPRQGWLMVHVMMPQMMTAVNQQD